MSSESGLSRNVKVIVAAAAAGLAVAGLWWWSRSHSDSKEKVCATTSSSTCSSTRADHGPHFKAPHVQRIRTPYGIGVLDRNQPYTDAGLMRVHLPNKAMGTLNPADCRLIPSSEPIYVTTPFGFGALVAPIQLKPDLVPDERYMYTVRLDHGVRANLNAESLRILHHVNPHPRVLTPYGSGVVVDPVQTSPLNSDRLTTNAADQIVIKFDGFEAQGHMNKDVVVRLPTSGGFGL